MVLKLFTAEIKQKLPPNQQLELSSIQYFYR